MSIGKGSVNRVTLIGNLGADPELKQTPNGTKVLTLAIATNELAKENQQHTEWHRVVFFNRLAEIVEQYLKKGSKVFVEGRLQTRSWEQDGVKRYTTEIVANEMQMLDSRGSAGAGDSSFESNQPKPQAQPQAAAQPAQNFDNFDDDIPF